MFHDFRGGGGGAVMFPILHRGHILHSPNFDQGALHPVSLHCFLFFWYHELKWRLFLLKKLAGSGSGMQVWVWDFVLTPDSRTLH